MFPSYERVKEIAKDGEYRRIPICREILSDAFSTIEVMRILRTASKHCYLLESASQQETWGRYSFLGYDPTMEITCTDGELTIRRTYNDGSKEETFHSRVKHPGETLREILISHKSPQIEGQPPFTGGLVGYFSYDYIKYAEPKLKLSGSKGADDFNDMDLMLFDRVIAFDHYRQKLVVIAGVAVPEDNKASDYEEKLKEAYGSAGSRIDETIDLLRRGEKKEIAPIRLETKICPVFSEEKYCDMVERGKEYIREGDIFQVVLSNPLTAKATGSLFDTYRILRTKNPSPYMFYFSSDDIELCGASPETLVKICNGVGSTFPLAGTRPRGKTTEEDEELERELLKDEKELAEHNMLVDLGRNDMGRISEIGSVRVEKYMEVQKFSHVMHIGSTVVGRIAKDKDSIDAIDAILPAGTLSGAPKFRACEIIEELEGHKRGIYGGAIGYLDFSGNLDTCIAIRLVYKRNDEIVIRSGAGIVADSVPKTEYEESCNKARAVCDSIMEAEEGLML